MLTLQRLAGNRATTALLRKGRITSEFTYTKPKTAGNKPGGWFRKTPRADEETKAKPKDREKYKSEWLIKAGGPYGNEEGVTDIVSLDAVKEVFAANLFSALAGARYAGKTRLIKGGTVPGLNTVQPPTRWVGSKAIPGFASYRDIIDKGEHPAIEGTLPGLARVLFVGLFIGESDWNFGNFGLSNVGDGRFEFRRVDIGDFAFSSAPMEKLLTPEGLIEGAWPIPYKPAHVDPKELRDAIEDLLGKGEQAITTLAEEFRPEFEELKGGAMLKRLVTELLERLGKLRSAAQKATG